MDLNAVMSAIVTDLRSNLSDPISDSRQSAQWVHRGAIKEVGKTPCVFVEPGPTGQGFEPVGGNKQLYPVIKVHCVIRAKDKGSSPLDTLLKDDDDELLDDIVQATINRMDGRHYGSGVCCLENISGEFPVDNYKKANTITFTVTQG